METTTEPTRRQRNVKAGRAPTERRSNGRMSKQARKVTHDVQEMGAIARSAALETLGDVSEIAAEYKDRALDKIQQMERAVEQFISARPLKSVVIAAGVGLLIGRFWKRR